MRRSDQLFLEIIFLLVLVAFSLAFLRLIEPFLLSIFLAVVLANIFRGTYRRIRDRTDRPRLAAALTTTVIILVVMIPVAVVTGLVTAEVIGVAEMIRGNWDSAGVAELLQDISGRLENVPVVGAFIQHTPNLELDLEATVREILKTSSDYILRLTQRSLGNITSAVFSFLVMLLLVFFLFLDGERIVKHLKRLAPMSNRDLDQISAELFNTTSATLISTIVIGLMEGALATLLFLVFGLPSPFLWGVITLVLSMIPLVGTNIVLIPAGLLTMLTGRPLAGATIIIVGVAGVTITQNVVRPKLVGDRTGLHPALALLATIGGIAWLGLIGFLVGPVVASLFIVTWRLFGRRYEGLLADKDGETS
jgi:predicted PurR-regulated permease PerM